jgi:hypothetical protein
MPLWATLVPPKISDTAGEHLVEPGDAEPISGLVHWAQALGLTGCQKRTPGPMMPLGPFAPGTKRQPGTPQKGPTAISSR